MTMQAAGDRASELLEDMVDVLRASEAAVTAENRVGLTTQVLEETLDLVDRLSGAVRACSDEGWHEIAAQWLVLKREVEKAHRRSRLRIAENEEALLQDLWWITEHGSRVDLALLDEVRAQIPESWRGALAVLEMARNQLLHRQAHDAASPSDDPLAVMQAADAAYAAHKDEWEASYGGQFIAVHDAHVLKAAVDRRALVDWAMKEQQNKGPFRVCIIEVGVPVASARGPRVRGRR